MKPGMSFKEITKYSWEDVLPQKQYQGKATILNLKYKPEYEELMDYFRAIVKSEEISDRSLELSGFVLSQLSSNYNAYYIRRKYLEAVPAEEKQLAFQKELEYITDIIEGNPKTYQAWEHRRFIVETLKDCEDEIEFLEKAVFKFDNKNYHGWSYRIWLCQEFDLYEEEFKRLDKYIEEDIRNNSIWNYRHFLLSQKILKNTTMFKENELPFIFESIKKAPDNESTWNYLLGWFKTYSFQSLAVKNIQENENKQTNDGLNNNNQTNIKKWTLSLLDYPEIKVFAQQMLPVVPKNRYLLHLCIQLNIAKPTPESLQQAVGVIKNQIAIAKNLYLDNFAICWLMKQTRFVNNIGYGSNRTYLRIFQRFLKKNQIQQRFRNSNKSEKVE